MSSPKTGSATPRAAASSTAGWALKASSICACDVHAALDDQFLGPPDDEVVAVDVAIGQVAAVQPASGIENGGSAFRILVVARHHARSGEEDLARLARRLVGAVGVNDAGLETERQTRSADLVQARGSGIGKDIAPALGAAHGLDERQMKLLFKGAVQGRSQGRRGRAQEADLLQGFFHAFVAGIDPVDKLGNNGGNQSRPRATIAGEPLPEGPDEKALGRTTDPPVNREGRSVTLIALMW